MKQKMLFIVFIIFIGFIISVIASPYKVDENMEFGLNDAYNLTNVNSTNLYQDGSKVLDTDDINGTTFNYSLYTNQSLYWDDETSQADLNVNSSTWWASLTGWSSTMFENVANTLGIKMSWFNTSVDARITVAEPGLNVNSSDYWDGLNDPGDIGSGDITDEGTWIVVGAEADLNVNNSDYWGGYGSINDFYLLNESSENLTQKNIEDFGFNINAFNNTETSKEGLVLELPFDSANYVNSSLTLDSSSQQNDGIVVGATFNASGGIDDSGAYSFDGVDDYVSVGLSDLNGVSHTFSAWFKPLTTVLQMIFTGDGSIGSNTQIYVGTGNELNFMVNNGTHKIYKAPLGVGDLNIGSWNYVAMSMDYSTNTMICNLNGITMFNGVPDNTDQAGDNDYYRIGRTAVYPFNGSIDEVRIWNRSLSATEIQNLYEQKIKSRDSFGYRAKDNSWYGTQTAPTFAGDVDFSYIQNSEFQCGADTYMTNISASGEAVVCTGISDVYLLNSGDTGTGDYEFNGNVRTNGDNLKIEGYNLYLGSNLSANNTLKITYNPDYSNITSIQNYGGYYPPGDAEPKYPPLELQPKGRVAIGDEIYDPWSSSDMKLTVDGNSMFFGKVSTYGGNMIHSSGDINVTDDLTVGRNVSVKGGIESSDDLRIETGDIWIGSNLSKFNALRISYSTNYASNMTSIQSHGGYYPPIVPTYSPLELQPNGGRVAIGSEMYDPWSWSDLKLTVEGNSLLYGDVNISGYTRINDDLKVDDDIMVGGNLGVGTESPEYVLDIENGTGGELLELRQYAAYNELLLMNDFNSAHNKLILSTPKDGAAVLTAYGSTDDNYFYFLNSSSHFIWSMNPRVGSWGDFEFYSYKESNHVMNLEHNGEVGINQVTPTSQLHVVQGTETGSTIHAYRDKASAATDNPVMFVEQDNAGDDQNALNIQQDGTGLHLELSGTGASCSAGEYGIFRNATAINVCYNGVMTKLG